MAEAKMSILYNLCIAMLLKINNETHFNSNRLAKEEKYKVVFCPTILFIEINN